MSVFMGREITKDFLEAWTAGPLSPLLELVKIDRDILLQLRGTDKAVDLYFKGNVLSRVTWSNNFCYMTFNNDFSYCPKTQILSRADCCRLLEEVPIVKHRIATGERIKKPRIGKPIPTDSEVEFEQLLIRQNSHSNRIHSEFFAVDRQVHVQRGRWDVAGVSWPLSQRRTEKNLCPVIVEFKHGLTANVGDLCKQLKGYHEAVSPIFKEFSQSLKDLLHQQYRMGLISGVSTYALEKLVTLEVSQKIEDLQYYVVLSDVSPRSPQVYMDKLKALTFSDQITIFNVGYSLWNCRGTRLSDGVV